MILSPKAKSVWVAPAVLVTNSMDITFFLKHHDYADYICLFSHRIVHRGQIAVDLVREANSEEKININNPRFSG